MSAVDEDDGDVPAVAARKFGVRKNVHLLVGVEPLAAGLFYLGARLVAEVAAGFGVEDDVRFVGHFSPPGRADGGAPGGGV